MSNRFWKFSILFILTAGCFAESVQAQYYNPAYGTTQDTLIHRAFDPHKLFIGGTIGLTFGNITYLNLSPSIGYRFSELLAAGVQVNTQYESVKYYDQTNALYKKDRYGVLGAGIFGRIYPIPQLFIHVQPEMNFIFGNTTFYNGNTASEKYREHAPSLLAGLGYSQNIGGNSAFTLMILYDVLQNPNSPYGSKPIFRAGVNFGL